MINLKQNSGNIILSVLMVAALGAAYLPDSVSMTDTLRMTFLSVFAVLVLLFISLIWKERPRDEREAYHGMYSAKLAYTAGVVMLAAGNIIQLINHTVDLWLPITLAVIVLVKIISRSILERSS